MIKWTGAATGSGWNGTKFNMYYSPMEIDQALMVLRIRYKK